MAARLDLRRRFVSNATTKVAFIIIGIVGLGVGRASAQSADAQALFNDGNQLMAEGKLAQACEAFEASNRVEPRTGTFLLLGKCREQNQQLASALSAYNDALTRAKNPDYRALAKERATALESRLSSLTVSVSDESRVGELTLTRNGKPFDSLLWNRALPVDGGDYIIAGHAPGHEDWQTTAHVPVEGAKISVEVPKLRELNKLISPPSPVAEHHDEAAQPRASDGAPAAPRASSKIVPLVIGAGSLMLLGGGVGFELWAESRYAAAKSEIVSQPRRDSLYNGANTQRHVAEALAVGGLAAGGAAIWLYLRDRNHERGVMTSTSVQVVPTAAGLAVSGAF
jgi:hypothetical protein